MWYLIVSIPDLCNLITLRSLIRTPEEALFCILGQDTSSSLLGTGTLVIVQLSSDVLILIFAFIHVRILDVRALGLYVQLTLSLPNASATEVEFTVNCQTSTTVEI